LAGGTFKFLSARIFDKLSRFRNHSLKVMTIIYNMKFTFSIRKKTLKDYPIQERLEQIFKNKQKFVLPDCGIITASNDTHFIGLQLLIYSLRKQCDAPLVVFDVGMTKEQLKWCSSTDCIIAPKFKPRFGMHYWEAWAKPFYLLNSPFKRNLWIDCDTMITGDLSEISFEQPFFTADHSGAKEGTYNKDKLYEYLPIEGITKDFGEYLNTGIFFLDLNRDQELLEKWCYCVTQAVENEKIAKNISCWDQGACKWALQKLNSMNLINPDKRFNYPALSRQYPFPKTPSGIKFVLDTVEKASNDTILYHWMGSPKPWTNWGEMLYW
jgi:hypothetical protein